MAATGRECVRAARRRVEDRVGTLPAEERALLERCGEDVAADRLRLEPLWEDGDTPPGDAVAALAGLLALRLELMHAHLDPLDVGAEEAATARSLLPRLCAWEDEARRALEASPLPPAVRDTAVLLHDTARVLSPPPPALMTGTALVPAPAGPAALRDLLARWEAHRGSRGLRRYVRAKWEQNRGFFRWGFAMPLYALRARRIRALLPGEVRSHPIVTETFAAIEQVGPVVDNFVFLGEGALAGEPHVAVADLAFLYMQLADELVDNLLKALGPARMRELVEEAYPRDERDGILVPLETLDVATLRAHGVDPDAPVEKYLFSLATLLAVLRTMRAAVVARLEALPVERREPTRAELQGFFRHCFATFLDELYLPGVGDAPSMDRLDLRDVSWHFFRKNNAVMMRWLVLRARAEGLAPERYAASIREWGAILADFQIFDDLKDVFLDHGAQPNYALQVAANLFPAEYRWIGENVARLGPSMSVGGVREVGRHAARTVLQCLRINRLIALARFGWLTVYVWDQRWQKSWTRAEGSFNRPDAPGDVWARDGAFATGDAVVDAVFGLFEVTADLALELDADDEYLAYVFDLAAYDHPRAVRASLLPSLRALYRFTFLRMLMSPAEKAHHLGRLLGRHRAAARAALAAYRDRGAREGFRVEPLELRLEGWLAPAPSLPELPPGRVSAPPRPERAR